MNYTQLTEKKKAQIDILLQQGLSMRKTAEILNIHHSTISRYKRGIYRKRKIDINKKYEVFIKYLFDHYDKRHHYTTMNIGMIQGGESVNSVAGKCEISIDFRIAKENHLKSILKKIKILLKTKQATLEIKQKIPPRINSQDISFLEKISHKKQTKCYLTEASYINKNFIILGPGPDTSHQKNEYIKIDSLKEVEYLYKKIIEFYNERN